MELSEANRFPWISKGHRAVAFFLPTVRPAKSGSIEFLPVGWYIEEVHS
jgi:hypothetical protein